ncbi:ISNCY family transposase [Micromonospora soli]|uniref:ISNCY family transposase n=1 Tax=Micromonospora sp. NBRC 110009 TaxID=3061627 RepID=UPI002672650C|nr:ISNCY family transposase [Micromonospora sp. NBRC 110009]WKT96873.1 ISNCY family transposase [Micromonospora sp. NBRC 110009]
MLRTRNMQPSLWESVLPEVCLRLPVELERVDAWLDDERFFAPFTAHFSPRLGRPSMPLETYLRLMFLKHRYRLGYESLCAEVSDSISWRRFARIDIDGRLPHPTTLMKITTRCGEQAIAALNEQLLATAVEARLVKTGKVRADTTVVPANVDYPTDTGLLARAVSRITRTVGRIKAAGAAPRTPFRDRTRAAGRRVRTIAAQLRLRGAQTRDQAQATVARITAELADLARKSATDAAAVLRNARRALRTATGREAGRLRRAVDDLTVLLDRTHQVIAQARTRLAGGTPDAATRLVSLHDPDARPIAKGRLGKPINFGYKAQTVDNVDGIVLDHAVEHGNPPDAPQLAPAIDRITRRTGRTPGAVAADRGYGEAAVHDDLYDAGVKTVAIPRKGRPGAARQAYERQPGFRRLVKWRTGCEGRISHLKHRYQWDRTRLDGLTGARTWCGYGVLAHNLTKVTALAATAA